MIKVLLIIVYMVVCPTFLYIDCIIKWSCSW